MKVENSSAYKLIFSINRHPQLGIIIEPFVMALNSTNTLSLTYQKVFSGNATYYTKLDQHSLDLIQILDPIMVENIIKLFSVEKKIRPKEYFRKYFNKDQFREEIRPFIEVHLCHLLSELKDSQDLLYIADDINPASERVHLTDEFSKVMFHFRRNEHGTKYFATVKYNNERIAFMKNGSLLITNQPAFMVAQQKLLRFYDFVEGSKLNVFLNRKFILVKPSQEREYFSGFVRKLMERSPVYSEGFKIENLKLEASPLIKLTQINQQEFGIRFQLKYGEFIFDYHPTKHSHVSLEWHDEDPLFYRVKRSVIWEESKVDLLQSMGLSWVDKGIFIPKFNDKASIINWLIANKAQLTEAGFKIEFDTAERFFLDKAKITYKVAEKLDWFDLNIKVQIGEFELPFKNFIKHIKQGNLEYRLPDNSIFIIPEEWMAIGEKLQGFRPIDNTYQIKKFQLDVLELVKSTKIKKHLNKLVEIQEESISKSFKGNLRPYQLEGLSWLMFLYKNNFGGILADDMGLGKTVQTLAFYQKIMEEDQGKAENRNPGLLIAPTSLLYNWEQEASHFTPKTKTHIHAGMNRAKNFEELEKYDLVITSYGMIRNDFELFDGIDFKAIIIDESQNIKNQSSKVTQFVNKLTGSFRLCLTGTPIENSIKDLWSQMNFLNKGLLGSMKQFSDHYVKPIEKQKDEKKTIELQNLIKPFVLRRTKSQVAKDLPEMLEQTILCPMSDEQEKFYEETKSEYRNQLLDIVEEKGLAKSKLSVLQGLTKLRLIANHPKLADKEFQFDSGKHTLILDYLRTALDENHKVLVFSQFVTYLQILEADLKKSKINYLKLTGSTSAKDRKKRVHDFQNSNSHPVFLISLKAGGTGLNLTAADYVFIVDPWWNPATEAQARDRTHRIGQVNNVYSYKFISAGTVEEKILKLQKRKTKYAKNIIQIEDNVIKSLTSADIKILFE